MSHHELTVVDVGCSDSRALEGHHEPREVITYGAVIGVWCRLCAQRIDVPGAASARPRPPAMRRPSQA